MLLIAINRLTALFLGTTL